MRLYINNTEVPVVWEYYAPVEDLKNILPLSLHMYNDQRSAQVSTLPRSVIYSDQWITTVPGDVLLYEGDKLVIMYDNRRGHYTQLGRIDYPCQQILELIGRGDAEVRLVLRG